MLPYASRLVEALDGNVGLACTAAVRPWVRISTEAPILLLPDADASIRPWCAETAESRRAWAWSLDLDPGWATLVGLKWLGGQRRIALDSPRYRGVANIGLHFGDGVEPFGEPSRISQCDRLGIKMPAMPRFARSPGRTMILEIPEMRHRREVAYWLELASNLASRSSLIVAHAGDLLPEMNEGLRALANRLSILALSRSEEILRLAGEVSTWIAPLGPAAILASQRDCPLVIFGAKDGDTFDFGLKGGRPTSPVRFLERSKPSAGELMTAVLDLSPHGM